MESIFKPFVTRFAQPILMSFIISWIFWNWEIVIGLIWYDSKTLELYGYKNYRELVIHHANPLRNYLYPTISALLFPLLRFALNWFNTFFRTLEKNKLIAVSGTGNVPTLKYLELRRSYDEKISELSKYLTEQADLQRMLNERDANLLQTQRTLEGVNEELNRMKQLDLTIAETQHDYMIGQRTLDECREEADKANSNFIYEKGELQKKIDAMFLEKEEYLIKSDNNYILGKFNIKLFVIDKGIKRMLSDSMCFITQGSTNLELHIDDIPFVEISSYYHNIIQDRFVVKLSNPLNDVGENWILLANLYLEFFQMSNATGFQSNFILDKRSYVLELSRND